MSEDIKLLEDRVTGLKQKISDLRKNKELFVKAQGMDEQIEKMRKDAEKHRDDARVLKDSNAKLTAKKNATITETLKSLCRKMNTILPAGEARITVSEDGDMFVGWKRPDGKIVPYHGLSGGEKIPFDNALAVALGCNILVAEYAELDAERFTKALSRFNGDGVQVIVSSCHEPAEIPKGWEVVRL